MKDFSFNEALPVITIAVQTLGALCVFIPYGGFFQNLIIIDDAWPDCNHIDVK